MVFGRAVSLNNDLQRNILNDFQAQSAARYLFNSSPRDICKKKEALQKETMA